MVLFFDCFYRLCSLFLGPGSSLMAALLFAVQPIHSEAVSIYLIEKISRKYWLDILPSSIYAIKIRCANPFHAIDDPCQRFRVAADENPLHLDTCELSIAQFLYRNPTSSERVSGADPYRRCSPKVRLEKKKKKTEILHLTLPTCNCV